MVPPEIFFWTTEHIARRITTGMMGIGRRKGDVEIVGFGARNDLLTPIGMNFTREIDIPLHGFDPVIRRDAQAA